MSYADITVLLDRSGSMSSIKRSMESGFREFLQQHRAVPSSRITLIQFDTGNAQEVVYTAKPITEASDLVIEPRGGTPLLDALCTAIDATGARLAAMPASARPDRVLFVIVTDGEENQSRTFKRADVLARVRHQSDIYKWQFVYLGANQDAFAEAVSFGIPTGMAVNFAVSEGGVKNVMRAAAANTFSYTSGQSVSVPDFLDEQRVSAMADEEDEIASSLPTTK